MPTLVKRAKICAWMWGILGVIIFSIGTVTLALFPAICKKKIHENLALREGKEIFEKWIKPPIPITFSAYLFNITNPREVQEEGRKPILQEVGPFVFQEWFSKKILAWDEKHNTVTYRDKRRFYFVPDKSADQEQKLYTVNIPLMGIVNRLKSAGIFRSVVLPILDTVIRTREENLFVHRTPRELLFEGYEVKFLEKISDLMELLQVSDMFRNNTFGFFYGRNNTATGEFTVYTGEDDISKFCHIASWNHKKSIQVWKDKYCGMINGTDGLQFAPPISRSKPLYAFAPDLCSSFSLEYASDVFVDDILAYRFMSPKRLFLGVNENPDNKCYCVEHDLCDVSGIREISKCAEGLEMFISRPHFYNGHGSYKDGVVGMSPNEEKHETYADVEPMTGLILRAARSLQMNFLLDSFNELPATKNAPRTLLPLFWAKEEAQIDHTIASAFTSRVKIPIIAAKSFLITCVILGATCIVLASIVSVYIVLKHESCTEIPLVSSYQLVPSKPEGNGKKFDIPNIGY